MLFIPKRGVSPYVPPVKHNIQHLISYGNAGSPASGGASFTLNSKTNLLIVNSNTGGDDLSSDAQIYNVIDGQISKVAGPSGFMALNVSQSGTRITVTSVFGREIEVGYFQYGGATVEDTETNIPLTYISEESVYEHEDPITYNIPEECNVIIFTTGSGYSSSYIGRPYIYYRENKYFTESVGTISGNFVGTNITSVNGLENTITFGEFHQTGTLFYFM